MSAAAADVDAGVLARIHALPSWRGVPVVAPLAGGMTNHNFRVADGGQEYVVRLGIDLPEHGVQRHHEPVVARAAHQLGLSPEVVHAGPGVMVSRFIAGRTLEPADLHDPARLAQVVTLLRRCHHAMPALLAAPLPQFDVFAVLHAYVADLQARSGHLLQQRLTGLAMLAGQLEAAVAPMPAVFGHNDLLAANLIDDGQRLWLIDWDYAGLSHPLFDLANLSTNNGLDSGLDAQLVGYYLGDAPTPGLMASLRAMQTASLLREVLWAAVSDCHRRVAFDFAAYTRACLERLDRHQGG